jgi:hypothetical protein
LLKTFKSSTRGRLGLLEKTSGLLKYQLEYIPASRQDYSELSFSTTKYSGACRMDLPGPTTSVGTRTNYSVGPWDYSTCAARHLMA